MSQPFKLTPPEPFVPKEFDEQVAIFEYFRWSKLPGVDLLYSTLNGVRVSIGQARKMKAAGMTRGVTDINLDVARGGFFGLRIELKRLKGGTVSDEQKDKLYRLREEGYKAEVCRGSKDAIKLIEIYLQMPRTVAIPFATEQD